MMIIQALTKRREEIAAEIVKLQGSLLHLDETIKLFSPEYKAPRIKHGDITRTLFDVLRNAEKPLNTQEISDKINIDIKRVGVALNAQKKKGLVTGKRDGMYNFWEIKHHPN